MRGKRWRECDVQRRDFLKVGAAAAMFPAGVRIPRDRYGWIQDQRAVESVLRDPDVPVHDSPSAWRALGRPVWRRDKRPVILFDALRRFEKDWQRGSQGTGDCVSWGWELACTLVSAVNIVVHDEPWQWGGEYATEPIYGGSRVEARGLDRGGWWAGSTGAWAAKWVTTWGALRRVDYSQRTGNPEHDLRTYSSRRAVQWANYGCGGQSDNDSLDHVAEKTPGREAHLCTSFDQAAAAIENGYPVPVASMQGFGSRGADGFAPPRGSWPHLMCFTGVRYDKPGLLLTNSWGNSWGTRAPFYPGGYWEAVVKCSAWVDPRTADRMLAQRDSYALTGIDGLKRRAIDWTEGWDVPGR